MQLVIPELEFYNRSLVIVTSFPLSMTKKNLNIIKVNYVNRSFPLSMTKKNLNIIKVNYVNRKQKCL